MAIIYYPKISPNDYDAFRSILNPDLPDTYDKWFDLARKQMREIILNGDTPIEVEVYPHQFAGYCHTGRHARTLDRREQFAAEKGSRQSQ